MKLSDFKTTKELTDYLATVYGETPYPVRSCPSMLLDTDTLRQAVSDVALLETKASIAAKLGDTPKPMTALERIGMEVLITSAFITRK